MMTPRDMWYDADTPDVSVVILNFNKSDLTRQCLEALWANTFGYRYEIVIVDNGSRAEEVQRLAQAGSHFRLIRLPENRYFGGGCNAGAQQSRGRHLVFLNNDAFVNSNWLQPLIVALEQYPDAGAAGPRMFSPDGRLQEAGAFVNEAAAPLRVGSIASYHPQEEFETRIVDYCSAACLAIPKRLFDELGGFDLLFTPGYYEDVDLCLKIAAASRFVYYCPESTVVHVGSATSNAVWNTAELTELFENNRRKFLARWGGWLKARAENREAPLPAPQAISGELLQ